MEKKTNILRILTFNGKVSPWGTQTSLPGS